MNKNSLSKKIIILFTFILISVFFIKCKQERFLDLVSIKPNRTFKESDNVRKINLSSFSDSVSYLTLKQDSNDVIGKITKLLVLKDRYVVVDLSLSKAIFIYDDKGRFIKKITRGNNLSEPRTLEDVAIDSKSNYIYIYSAALAQIFTYNKDGVFLKKIQIPNGYFSAFDKIDEGFLFYRELEKIVPNDVLDNARLCFIDSLGIYKKGFFKYVRSEHFQIPRPKVFFKKQVNNNLVFSSLDSTSLDTLYEFNGKSMDIKPVLAFDFGKREEKFAYKYFSLQSTDEYLNLISHSSLSLGIPVFTNNWIIGQYSTNKIIYSYLYNIKTHLTSSGAGFKNDIDGIPIASEGYMEVSDNIIYTTVDVGLLLFEHEAFIKYKIKDPFLKSTKQSILTMSLQKPEIVVIAKIYPKADL